jgi:AraC-like DNA-binding protein
MTLVLDGILVEHGGSDGRAVQPLSVMVHPGGGAGVLRRSADSIGARVFELRLGGSWEGRLRECGVSAAEPPLQLTGGRVNALLTQIHVETVRPAAASAMAIGGLTLTLLAELRRTLATGRAGRTMPEWLRRAVTLIHARYRSELRMAELAREVGVHPVHLSRGFRRAFGVTMTEYVRDLRIHFAAEAMVSSRDPLPSIAQSAGYQNMGHFTRCFKRATGMTPAAYRGARIARRALGSAASLESRAS